MPRITNLEISESLEELQTSLKEQTAIYLSERIQALILIKMGKVDNIRDIESFLGRHYSTIARWIRAYEQKGLGGILEYKRGYRIWRKTPSSKISEF